ncbi:hypothetical protein [Demequina gelatinilytica]|uniref:hypothetical protein n=1 Tax=Demequina gelatinilytica TaxID=1638980 RepID=UPI0007842C90|nr:hypothetical protein [Demequina gelatinilytica]
MTEARPPAQEPGPGAAATGDPAPTEAAPAAPRAPRRRGLVVALVAACLLAAALAVPLALLATARHHWEGQNAELRGRADTLAVELTDAHGRIAELETVEQELANLKEEYSSAVNQGARGTELVTELEDIVAAYQHCVDAQAEHFDVLRHRELYVASSIEASERSIEEYCAEVDQAFEDFQAAHG